MTPFTTAKAISTNAESTGKIISGDIDHSREFIWIDDNKLAVAPYSICLNSNLFDIDGNEIFEGDFLVDPSVPNIKFFAFFDTERAAFYTSHVESIHEVEIAGDDEFRFCDFPSATVYKRLTQERASSLRVVSSFLDEIAFGDPVADDDFDDSDADGSDF